MGESSLRRTSRQTELLSLCVGRTLFWNRGNFRAVRQDRTLCGVSAPDQQIDGAKLKSEL